MVCPLIGHTEVGFFKKPYRTVKFILTTYSVDEPNNIGAIHHPLRHPDIRASRGHIACSYWILTIVWIFPNDGKKFKISLHRHDCSSMDKWRGINSLLRKDSLYIGQNTLKRMEKNLLSIFFLTFQTSYVSPSLGACNPTFQTSNVNPSQSLDVDVDVYTPFSSWCWCLLIYGWWCVC